MVAAEILRVAGGVDSLLRAVRTARTQRVQHADAIPLQRRIADAKPIKKPKATCAEPALFADVEYRDITSEGLLRQSSFKGLKRN